jgi:hypothetical protein
MKSLLVYCCVVDRRRTSQVPSFGPIRDECEQGALSDVFRIGTSSRVQWKMIAAGGNDSQSEGFANVTRGFCGCGALIVLDRAAIGVLLGVLPPAGTMPIGLTAVKAVVKLVARCS